MSDNTSRPDAEQPSTTAGYLSDEFDTHVMSESNFHSAGVDYEVNVWLDEDTGASVVADVCESLRQAGYDLERVEWVESTDSLHIGGKASSE